MRQLGVIDSAFINLENPTVPQQIGGVGIYDPSTAPGKFVRFKDVLANFEQRFAKLPIFRTRLVEVPLGLDRPYWVIDPDFDVEFHIRHIALPQPGDWRQLCIQVARLHSRPLDMSRPLWEVYIIEGLDNIPNLPKGSFAIYTKMHHSLVDGAGGQDFMSALHDLEPVPARNETESRNLPVRFADIQPSNSYLLGKSLLRSGSRFVAGTRGLGRTIGGLVSMARRISKKELPPMQVMAPKVRFDQPVGRNRVFEAVQYDLSEFKAMKDAAGLTINDVAVAIIAGALRKYLLKYDELPEESLLASMPVNLRSRVGETDDNNQVGAMTALLHTNIADPVERLNAIKKSLDDAKQYIDTPMTNVVGLAGSIPPMLAKPLTRMYVRRKLTRRLPMGQATVITNVPGPSMDLYCAGARLVSYYPMGLINPGLGLFHAVFSFNGKIAISITADRDQMPDPQFYRECIEKSYAELHNALLGKPAQVVSKRRTPRGAASKRASSSRRVAQRPALPHKKRAAARKTATGTQRVAAKKAEPASGKSAVAAEKATPTRKTATTTRSKPAAATAAKIGTPAKAAPVAQKAVASRSKATTPKATVHAKAATASKRVNAHAKKPAPAARKATKTPPASTLDVKPEPLLPVQELLPRAVEPATSTSETTAATTSGN